MATGAVYYSPTFGYYQAGANPGANIFGGVGNIVGGTTNKAMWDSYVRQGIIKPLGAGPASSGSGGISLNPSSYSTNYTPNAITAAQLAGSGIGGGGAGTIPHWMQQAYANKMARMGAPANGPLPYKLTDSSFGGMAPSANQVAPVASGKAAPSGGV